MSSRQTEKQTGTTGHGGGLGAPGTTGATRARDPLGAPGSTGASRTTLGAPEYDPTEYGTTGGGQTQLHRPGTDIGTGQGYTYGTASSMGPTATGYHATVHVPHTTGITGTYDTTATGGGYDTEEFGSGGAGGGAGGGRSGYDVGKMGDRAHGYGGERGGHLGMTGTHGMGDTTSDDVGDIISVEVLDVEVGEGGGGGGGGSGSDDTGKMDERNHGAGGEKTKYDTGGTGQRRGS